MKEIRPVTLVKYSNDILNTNIQDNIIEESPLQIIIDHGKIQNRIRENLSVTMRTPGDDLNLVAGFLFCEGIIKHASDILSMKHIGNTGNKNYQENILRCSCIAWRRNPCFCFISGLWRSGATGDGTDRRFHHPGQYPQRTLSGPA